MLPRSQHIALFALLLALAMPAEASGSGGAPETSGWGLFLLGLAGVIIGRQCVILRQRQERKEDRDK